jgi:uncharacterized protein
MSFKKTLKRWLPEPETFFKNRWLRWCEPWMGHPRLWNLHRRSVALGVAIGLMTGLIPGPVQIFAGVLLAIALRANVPAVAMATLYTNPITFVPLYMLAYNIGGWITGDQSQFKPPTDIVWSWSTIGSAIPDMLRWIVSLGDTLLIGLAIQATLTAFIGYVATLLIWRCAVSAAWRKRSQKRVQKRA